MSPASLINTLRGFEVSLIRMIGGYIGTAAALPNYLASHGLRPSKLSGFTRHLQCSYCQFQCASIGDGFHKAQ